MKLFVRNIIVLIFVILSGCKELNINSKNMSCKFNFYTQHNQFYLADKNSPKNTDTDSFWDIHSSVNRIGEGNGIIGVVTESYGPIKGELNILRKENDKINYEVYDHIVETNIDFKSTSLQILDCPNFSVESEVKITPGKYRVRVYFANLKSVIDEDEGGDDYYYIEIWPSNKLGTTIIKQYEK